MLLVEQRLDSLSNLRLEIRLFFVEQLTRFKMLTQILRLRSLQSSEVKALVVLFQLKLRNLELLKVSGILIRWMELVRLVILWISQEFRWHTLTTPGMVQVPLDSDSKI